MPQDPQPTADEIAENLTAGLEALPKGPEAVDAVYDGILQKRKATSSNEDRPEIWREGEPMPDWAEESVKLADQHRKSPAD